jgi:hypothetical protein
MEEYTKMMLYNLWLDKGVIVNNNKILNHITTNGLIKMRIRTYTLIDEDN